MRKFYLFVQKGQTLSAQLTWSHYSELLSIKDINKINYYIEAIIKQNLSVRELRNKIKNKEYERLDDKVKNKLNKKMRLNNSFFLNTLEKNIKKCYY